jgi:DNA-binding MarR family transcriptional regulator
MSRSQAPVEFYRADGYRREESVDYLVRRITTSMIQQANRRLVEHGVTSTQWAPLFRIRMSRSPTVADLARELDMDAGAMTRLLDRLEKKGFCKRVRSAEDRRVVNIELTHDGEAAIAEVPAVLAHVQNAHLAGFSRSEWQALHGYLQRMLANGEAVRNAAGPPADPPGI